MANLPANTPDLLRAAGLKVKGVPGWKTRARPASTGGFTPVGVLCHHTVTGPKVPLWTLLWLLVRGRSDLPGPLCQIALMRDGTVWMIAAGRGNHAGKAKASGSVAAGDGNALYIGIEAANDGVGEPWSEVQYAAYVKLAAVLCKEITGNSSATVRGHKETSVTGKIDPTFDMDKFRADVAAEMTLATPARRSPENSVTRGRAHLHGAIDLLVAANNDFRQAKGRTAVRTILVAGTSAAAAILRTALKRGPKR